MCLDRNSGGGSSDTDSPLELPLAFDIDTQGLKKNKCANSVYLSLKSKVGLFKNLLGNFDGNNSILNLSINVKSISSPKGNLIMGQTSSSIDQIKNGYISIDINTDAMGSSSLGIAAAFIHEMVHAKMIRDLVNSGWKGDLNSLKEINSDNLPTLLDAYQKYNYETWEDSQHKFMSEYYIPKIANALAQFDGNKHDKADYENLAWTPLQMTAAYNALSQAKKNKIAEANNTFNSKSPCGK